MLWVPASPAHLVLDLVREWDGAECPVAGLRGRVSLSATEDGLRVEASLEHSSPARVPAAPPGTRVDRLWEYDVVECFLVGEDGRYLELELGAAGHHLVLRFDAPRRSVDAQPAVSLDVDLDARPNRWTCRCALPREWLPERVRRINAFAIAGGRYLAWSPLPGEQPDFHQPDRYPSVRVEGWDR